MFNQEDIGIFGDTQQGVPNPRVGHVHPYPTRYHGPIWTQPQAGYPYRAASYVQAPFVGYGLDACPRSESPVLYPKLADGSPNACGPACSWWKLPASLNDRTCVVRSEAKWGAVGAAVLGALLIWRLVK